MFTWNIFLCLGKESSTKILFIKFAIMSGQMKADSLIGFIVFSSVASNLSLKSQ